MKFRLHLDYDVIADSEDEAIKTLARYQADPHLQKVEDLKTLLKLEPTVKLVDLIVHLKKD